MKFMTKKKVFAVGLIVSLLILMVGGIRYQQLVDEGSYLADEHCIKVSPLVKERKNIYIKQLELMEASASTEEVHKALADYKQTSEKYLKAEQDWLKKQKQLLNRWDFKFLSPNQIQQSANTQYRMYEADAFTAQYMLSAFDAKDPMSQEFIYEKVAEFVNKSTLAGEEYNKVFSTPYNKLDPRFYFKIPLSKCPPENLDLPIIPNIFAPEVIQEPS